MSRHEIRGREPHVAIVVGWDSPLKSFFAQVWDERAETEEEALLAWAGCYPGEIPTVGILAAALEPFATLPPETASQLARDRADDLAAINN